MADRVSASITIGGTLPATALAGLAATIQLERLSTEWDGEPFTLADMPQNAQIGRAAGRGRVWPDVVISGVAVSLKKKQDTTVTHKKNPNNSSNYTYNPHVSSTRTRVKIQ